MSILNLAKPPKKNVFSTYSIAVIGGGASAVAFVKSFVDRVNSRGMSNIKLTIFEKEKAVGPGFPYKQDFDCLRLNSPAEVMSVCATNSEHFEEWLYSKKEYRKLYTESKFLPRWVFGDYLTETLYTSIVEAKNSIQCEILFKKIEDINKQDNKQYEVMTEDGQSFLFDFVILAVGAVKTDDHYQLMGQPGYIHDVYPAQEALVSVGKTETVGIIGTGLAAVDMVLALRYRGHEGNISMISRNGRLPSVVDKRQVYETAFFTVENFKRYLEQNHYVSLRYVIRLLRKEFKAAGLNLRETLLNREEQQDDLESIGQKIMASRRQQAGFNILSTIIPAITDQFWNDVPSHHKKIFIQKYMSDIIQRRTPLPLINVNQIYDLLLSKQLQILGGIKSICKWEQKFHVSFLNGQETLHDYIINATGPSVDVSKNNLIKRLLTKGYLVENDNGGIQVNYDSGAVIDRDKNENETFRAIGYIAHGTYLFVNNLPVLLPIAHKIAGECVEVVHSIQVQREQIRHSL